MRLVSVLLLVLLSGGVMAAPDNLNGKKFEQLEQMIKDLEGQMTALTIENALLNDAVSDLDRDVGEAEFEIIQLENTVAILSAGGEGDSGEVTFVGFSDETFQGNGGLNEMIRACQDKFGESARMANTEDRLFSSVIIEGSGWANPIGVQLHPEYKIISDSTGFAYSGNIRVSTISCSSWSTNKGYDTIYRRGFAGATIGQRIGASQCDRELPVACSAPI